MYFRLIRESKNQKMKNGEKLKQLSKKVIQLLFKKSWNLKLET